MTGGPGAYVPLNEPEEEDNRKKKKILIGLSIGLVFMLLIATGIFLLVHFNNKAAECINSLSIDLTFKPDLMSDRERIKDPNYEAQLEDHVVYARVDSIVPIPDFFKIESDIEVCNDNKLYDFKAKYFTDQNELIINDDRRSVEVHPTVIPEFYYQDYNITIEVC